MTALFAVVAIEGKLVGTSRFTDRATAAHVNRKVLRQKEIVKSRTAFLSGTVKNADSDNPLPHPFCAILVLLALPDE